MRGPETEIIEKMFAAFAAKDIAQAMSTVSEEALWIHHGTSKLPAMRFIGKNGVQKFFETNFNSMQMEYFRVQQIVQQDKLVLALGEEKFTITGREGNMAQKWVQVYKVENGLITRMDEFATSAEDADYGIVA